MTFECVHTFCFRMQAVVIGQALLDAGYLEIIGGQQNIFQDNFTLYKPSEVIFY